MVIETENLRYDWQAVLALTALYTKHGYVQYKTRKFEEYELYARNKEFLSSDNILSFTDMSGKLMALKPDVTLSIVKNTRDPQGPAGTVQKLCYDENVYRVSKGTHRFKEIKQVGLECIGDVNRHCVSEVLCLAVRSLMLLSQSCVIEVSDLSMLFALYDYAGVPAESRSRLTELIHDKNAHELAALCDEIGMSEENKELLKELISYNGKPSEVFASLEVMAKKIGAEREFECFEDVVNALEPELREKLRIDFSVVGDISYYNGIVFKGFVKGIPGSVLSGGRYDPLMRKMGRKSRALGFAVYIDMLERLQNSKNEPANLLENTEGEPGEPAQACPQIVTQPAKRPMLNVALPKGRLGEKVYSMFEKAGYPCPSIKEENRKLIFENEEAGVRYFWVKPSDVAIYVERGAADIGVAGKDILLEYEPDIYELLDLNIGKCKMSVAGPRGFQCDMGKTLRVATKFSNIAENYYASMGRDIDIIHLNGSIEIAPILGLSDVIVDIVETGATLKANNLEVLETVCPISARLISNKASYKFKTAQIEAVMESLREQVK